MTDTLLVIPTYNNAGTLENVLQRARSLGLPVLVVDDGSTDATPEILRRMGVQVLTHPRNRGKGAALKTGLRWAREQGFSYAVTLDSDGQHFPEDVPALLARQAPGTLVVGSRDTRGANAGSSFANRFSNFWFALYTGIRLPDTQTGFRLYPLRDLPPLGLVSARYEAELALLVFSAWRGCKLVPVPVRVAYPEDRVSHFRPFRDFFRITVLNTLLLPLAIIYGWPARLFRK